MPIPRREWMLSAVASAAGCGGKRRRAPEPNSITVLYPYDETVLGPKMSMPAQFLMFLPLVAWNTRGELEGRLAERWEHSPDYRTWTIRLRDGIRWHDGVPVTAHDIKFTLDLGSHPDVMWFTPDSFTVKVIDDLTYTITYQRDGLSGGVMDDWNVYYPKHRTEKLDPKEFYHWDFWTHPVGNGPYRHVRTVPKTMLHLEANREHYRGRPKIANVVLKLGGNEGAGVIPELLSGNADAATEVKRTDALKLANDPRFRVYDQIYHDAFNVLFWNHRHPLFQDASVRRALTLAINRRELFQVLNLPRNAPVFDAPFSQRQLRRRDFPEPISYDPGLANRMLDEAGWGRRNRHGTRERDGRGFSFALIRGSHADSGESEAAVYIQARLKRIGVRMNIDSLEGQAVHQRTVTGDYEAAICVVFTGWGADVNGPRRFLRAAGYTNPRFLKLADQLQGAFDPDEEDRLYHEVTRLFQEDVPATFLSPSVYTTIASRRIRGLDSSPYPGDLTWCMEELSLEGAI